MKLEITKTCSVICEPGSIVEVSEKQANVLGGFSKPVKEKAEKAEEKVETPKKAAPKAAKKKEV